MDTQLKILVILAVFLMDYSECGRLLGPNQRPGRNSTPTPMIASPPSKETLCDLKCCLCDKSLTTVRCDCTSECQDIALSEGKLPDEIEFLTITKCRRLKIGKKSIQKNRNLRYIKLERIEALEIGSLGFYFPYNNDSFTVNPYAGGAVRSGITNAVSKDQDPQDLLINIHDSKFEMVAAHSFTGAITNINIKNCRFKILNASSFATMEKLKTFVINETVIDKIDSEAIKDISTRYFVLARSTINRMERNAINADVYNQTTIRHNIIGTILSESIRTKQPYFMFTNNTVDELSGHALEITAYANVTLEGNRFRNVRRHAFHHIRPMNTIKTLMDFNFIRNSLLEYERGSLTFSEDISSLKVSELILPENCTSDFTQIVLKLLDKSPTVSSVGRLKRQAELDIIEDEPVSEDTGEEPFVTEGSAAFGAVPSDRGTVGEIPDATTSLPEPRGKLEDVFYDAIYCSSLGKTISLFRFKTGGELEPKQEDGNLSWLSIFSEIAVPVILVILLCVITALIACYYTRQRRRKQANYGKNMPERRLSVKLSNKKSACSTPGEATEKKWIIAVPDTRLYQESELQVTLEYAQPIEETSALQVRQEGAS